MGVVLFGMMMWWLGCGGLRMMLGVRMWLLGSVIDLLCCKVLCFGLIGIWSVLVVLLLKWLGWLCLFSVYLMVEILWCIGKMRMW